MPALLRADRDAQIARVRNAEARAVFAGSKVALEDFTAGFRAEVLGCVAAAAVSTDDVWGFRKLYRDGRGPMPRLAPVTMLVGLAKDQMRTSVSSRT